MLAHTKKQDEPQSTASIVLSPTSPWFQLLPLCLLNPPHRPFFSFPPGVQIVAALMVVQPQSHSRVKASVVCTLSGFLCSYVVEDLVTLSCDIVKWLQ